MPRNRPMGNRTKIGFDCGHHAYFIAGQGPRKGDEILCSRCDAPVVVVEAPGNNRSKRELLEQRLPYRLRSISLG